ncbi:hypothetical protein [Clostridium cadaveris]|nr:hypothetical protein [Clostridium cadaveris]
MKELVQRLTLSLKINMAGISKGRDVLGQAYTKFYLKIEPIK